MVHQPMQPAFIDFHDAVIASITLQRDSSLIITFDRLCFFYSVERNEYEVWVCAASIACSGVRTFELKGKLDPGICVSHGSMQDAEEREIPTLTADETPLSLMSLTLMSGTDVRLSLESAKLHALKRVKQLENWTGPLR